MVFQLPGESRLLVKLAERLTRLQPEIDAYRHRDKDEEAFGVIEAHAGILILVSREPRETAADGRLGSPQAARRWLEMCLSHP